MRTTSENDWLRLQHMLDAAQHALTFADGHSRTSLEEDFQFQFALARALEIVCEAACNITAKFQEDNPQIEWQEIKGMRQWLAHAYFKLDLDVLWDTVTNDIPPLIDQLQKLIKLVD